MTAEEILEAVEVISGVSRANIRSPRRMPHVCRARCLAALLLADEGHLTNTEIAGLLRRAHRTTVTRELRRAEKLRLNDEYFRKLRWAAIEWLKQREAA